MAIAIPDIRCATRVPGATLVRSIAVSVGVCSLLSHLSEQGAVNGTSHKIVDPLIQPPTPVVNTDRLIVQGVVEEHGSHFNH